MLMETWARPGFAIARCTQRQLNSNHLGFSAIVHEQLARVPSSWDFVFCNGISFPAEGSTAQIHYRATGKGNGCLWQGWLSLYPWAILQPLFCSIAPGISGLESLLSINRGILSLLYHLTVISGGGGTLSYVPSLVTSNSPPCFRTKSPFQPRRACKLCEPVICDLDRGSCIPSLHLLYTTYSKPLTEITILNSVQGPPLGRKVCFKMPLLCQLLWMIPI